MLRLERETCSRCGGGGYFRAFSHIYGGRCFKCSGAGVVLTRAGSKIATMLLDAQRVGLADLKVGEVVWDEGLDAGSFKIPPHKVRFDGYKAIACGCRSKTGDEPEVDWNGKHFEAHFTALKPSPLYETETRSHCSMEMTFRQAWTTEQTQSFLASIRYVGKRDRKGIIEVEDPMPEAVPVGAGK